MKARLVTIFSALLLLLFLAVVVLWVRSYAHWEQLSIGRRTPVGSAGACSGGAIGLTNAGEGLTLSWTRFHGLHDAHLGDVRAWRALGLYHSMEGIPAQARTRSGSAIQRVRGSIAGGRYERVSVCLPHWAAAIASGSSGGVAVGVVLLGLRRRSWNPTGLCPSCKYDLRATPARCPECGLVPATPPPSP